MPIQYAETNEEAPQPLDPRIEAVTRFVQVEQELVKMAKAREHLDRDTEEATKRLAELRHTYSPPASAWKLPRR